MKEENRAESLKHSLEFVLGRPHSKQLHSYLLLVSVIKNTNINDELEVHEANFQSKHNSRRPFSSGTK